MFTKEIEALLHKSLQGLPLVVCRPSLKHDIDDLMMMALPRMKLAVIVDSNTEIALGKQVMYALKSRFDCTRILLEGTSADSETVEYIRRCSTVADALVAVGSGTINDLCKYASFLDGKPYVVFPTAASMNGYVSANASISENGYKTTFMAHMPKAVFCDLSIIAEAPSRLNKSGLGDSLARPTAQADWLLSHLMLGTPYNEIPFNLLKDVEPHLFEQARGVAMNDMPSLELLMGTLLLSGFGMTIAGGSYPASQGEHMIAHAYEMLTNRAGHRVGVAAVPSTSYTFHGEEIGVTTLTMARLQEQLLRHNPVLKLPSFHKENMTAVFGEHVTEEASKAYKAKLETVANSKAQRWDDVAHRLQSVMLPSGRIQSVLKAAEAPDTPEALGWTAATYDTALAHARFLRDRFTFLDLY